MSNILSCFAWQKTYGYFTEKNQSFDTITLNWFQRVLRWLHINYTNTHLEKVANIAHEKCFNPDLLWTDDQKKIIAQILKKKEFTFVNLGTVKKTFDDKPYSVGYAGKYVGKEGLLEFCVTLMEENNSARSARIKLQKGAQKITTVTAIHEITINRADTFTTVPGDRLAKETYVFLAKILTDSSTSTELKMSDKQMDPIGGAIQAYKYGFRGGKIDFDKPGNFVQAPNGMRLSLDEASKVAWLCTNNKVQLDVLYLDSSN